MKLKFRNENGLPTFQKQAFPSILFEGHITVYEVLYDQKCTLQSVNMLQNVSALTKILPDFL